MTAPGPGGATRKDRHAAPYWLEPPPTPPHPTASPTGNRFLRGVVVVLFAALGLFIGGMAGSAFVLLDYAVGTVLMLVGMWVGLALGIWLGVWVIRRTPRPINPAQYPNQTFRRV